MLQNVLKLLEFMSRRTEMFVNPVQIETVQSYLHGLQAGCALGGLEVSSEVYRAAAKSRGWTFRSTGIIWHMRAKKLSNQDIIKELIAVQAEAFQRAAVDWNRASPQAANDPS
jgi:hypothetical protein